MKPALSAPIVSRGIAAVGIAVVITATQASATQRLPPLRFDCYLAGSIYQGYQMVLRNQSTRASPPGTVVRWKIPVPTAPGSNIAPKVPNAPFVQIPASPTNPWEGAYAIPRSLAPGATVVVPGTKVALKPDLPCTAVVT
jgi:hypothetical protein